jgi:hypothetical protein
MNGRPQRLNRSHPELERAMERSPLVDPNTRVTLTYETISRIIHSAVAFGREKRRAVYAGGHGPHHDRGHPLSRN